MADSNDAQGAVLAARFTKAALGFARDRNLCADILVEFGDEPRIVRIRHGKVEAIEEKIPLLYP